MQSLRINFIVVNEIGRHFLFFPFFFLHFVVSRTQEVYGVPHNVLEDVPGLLFPEVLGTVPMLYKTILHSSNFLPSKCFLSKH